LSDEKGLPKQALKCYPNQHFVFVFKMSMWFHFSPRRKLFPPYYRPWHTLTSMHTKIWFARKP